MFDRTCNWGNCEDTYTDVIRAPLCNRHVVYVYKQVSEIVNDPRMVGLINVMLNPDDVPTRAPGRARPRAKSDMGTIYFARFGDLVKIGFTTNLKQRMKALRPDEVLATVEGTMSDEEKLHYRFGHLWDSRELFRLEGELAEMIERLKGAVA